MTQQSGPDWKFMFRDAREQLCSAVDTLAKLQDKCELIKNKLLFHVDQGEGMTQEQLVEVYVEFERLFPRRVRKTSEGLDARL